MRPAAIVLVVLALVAILTVAAWVTVVWVGVPIGGVSRSDATSIASRNVHSDSPIQVVDAVPSFFWFYRSGSSDTKAPASELIWAITLHGTFPGNCPPAGPAPGHPRCQPTNHTETVDLDYRTGAFITAVASP
jgi:hypothetical protein